MLYCGTRRTKYSSVQCNSAACNICTDAVNDEHEGCDEEAKKVGSKLCASSTKSNSACSSTPNEIIKRDVSQSRNVQTSLLKMFGKRPAVASSNAIHKNDAKLKQSSSSPVAPEPISPPPPTTSSQPPLRPTHAQPPQKKFKTSSLSNENKSNEVVSVEVFDSFKKVFPELKVEQIHNFHICSENNCGSICSEDLAKMTKMNTFQHKWLTDPSIANTQKQKSGS